MVNSIKIGYNLRVALADTPVSATGITLSNCLLIYKFLEDGTGFLLHNLQKKQYQFTDFDKGSVYILAMLAVIDLSAFLAPPFLPESTTSAIKAEDGIAMLTEQGALIAPE